MEKSPHERANPLRRAPAHRYRRPVRVTPRPSNDVVRTPEQNAADESLLESVSEKLRSQQPAKPAMPRLTRSFVLRRETVERRAEEHRRKIRKKYGWHIVGVLIALVVIGSLGVIVWGFRDLIPIKLNIGSHTQTPQAENTSLRGATSASTLDETPISSADIINHKMAADEPRSITIPKLNIQARILRVGISLDSEPIAPGNIYDVGWFEASGKPGNSTAVLLNGNSHGPTKPGVFVSLKDLAPGDVIMLERGNGTRLTYLVHKVQEYPGNQIDMAAALQPIEPGKQGLNLMTTHSKYNANNGTNDKRYVIFTVLQSN